MITLLNHTVLKSGNIWCHIVNSRRLIQQPLRGWRQYCIMCWLAGRDDLIIVVFMDHWAAGLDFCYWIMGNSFFLLKEWPSKSNKRVSSPWSGSLHHSEAAAAMSFSLHTCGSETWQQEVAGVCGAHLKPSLLKTDKTHQRSKIITDSFENWRLAGLNLWRLLFFVHIIDIMLLYSQCSCDLLGRLNV